MTYTAQKKGFTLVELMIVMAIIAILTVGGFASYEGVKKSARDGRRKADLENIRGALELYFADHKYYPPATVEIEEGVYEPLLQCGTDNYISSSNGSINYLKVPCDPKSSEGYSYLYEVTDPSTNTYILGTILESESPDNCTETKVCKGPDTACNYCVYKP